MQHQTSWAVLAASLVVAASIGALAQGTGGPASVRDQARPSRDAEVSTLTGRVLEAGTNLPLNRATVQLWANGVQTSKWTTTDVNGRWTFTTLGPGNYRLSASRDGYVALGSSSSGTTPLTVVVPRQGPPLEILLSRGGVIAGRVVDEIGAPVVGVRVHPLRVRFVDGQRQLMTIGGSPLGNLPSNATTTDDRGEYRLYGLASGTYFVAVTYNHRGGGPTDDRRGYPMTFHPQTASVLEARPVPLEAGKLAIADISMAPTSFAVVSGTVVAPSADSALEWIVILSPVATGHAMLSEATNSAARVRSGESFRLSAVPPGSYFLRARSSGRTGAFASVRVDVQGEDIEVALAPSEIGVTTGQVVIDSPEAPVSMTGFFLQAVALDSEGDTWVQSFPVDEKGRFALSGVGRHLIRLFRPTQGWLLRSVTIGGEDVTDTGYVFGSSPGPIEVTLTRNGSSISGSVSENGRPVGDYTVVAFAPDRRTWTPRSRWLARGAPDDRQTFTVSDLLPGEYIVVAVPTLEAGDETDPERLTAWMRAGRRVTLVAGETTQLFLELARP